ncbi:MAG TPA: 4-oxalocrotonate tautomerase [Dehalococcoidales bacterium]|nr:4-oxalocrotonate tautomerase [Dehalococcoidales bacterium]
MPLVTIKIFEGRTVEQKRAMAKAVTEALVKTINCKPDAVHIAVLDMKKENLAQGGKLMCD